MKGYRRFIITLGILFAVFVIVKITSPDPIRWEESLRADDKNPYGTYILSNSLNDLFPHTSIENIRKDIVGTLGENDKNQQAYIAIAPDIYTDSLSIAKLLQFVRKGNTALLAAEDFDQGFLDSLHLHIEASLFNFKDPASAFSDSGYAYLSGNTKSYSCRTITLDNYFDTIGNKYPVTILGTRGNKKQEVNFVQIKIGNGLLLLHVNPLVFSNYFLIRNGNEDYVSKVLSYIPNDCTHIYWDKYYTEGKEEPTTPFRFLLSNHWLQIGLYLTLILLLLYVCFHAKRQQRPIPVLTARRNTTEDYIKTIASLYFNQKSNREIGQKKAQYWLSYIRRNYYIDTTEHNKEFITSVAKKTGTDEKLIQKIVAQIPEEHSFFLDKDLQHFNHNLNLFYQQTNV